MNRIFVGFLILFLLGELLQADLIIKDGSVKNENTGPVKFDTNNDGTQDITFTQDGKVGVGVSTPTHTFDLKGSFGMIPQTVTSDTTLSGNTLILADTSGASITITLPLASAYIGRMYEIKKVSDSNSLTIQSKDLIEKSEFVTLTTSSSGFAYINVFSDGGKWNVRSQSIENSYAGSGNLIGWWRLDETTGTTAYDGSGQGHDATWTGGVTFSTNTTSGKFNRAVETTASGYQMDFTSSALPSSQITLSLWVKFNDISGTSNLFRHNWVGVGGWTLFEWSDNKIYFGVASAGPTQNNINSDSTVSTGVWYHIAASYDGSVTRLYINGVQQAGSSSPGAISLDTSGTVNLGSNAKATMDDMRIYDRALNSAEVLEIYNSVD